MEETGKEIPSRLTGFKEGTFDQVYTNNLQSFTPERRLLYCQFCKFYIFSILYGAQCRQCNSNMITYFGNNSGELAR